MYSLFKRLYRKENSMISYLFCFLRQKISNANVFQFGPLTMPFKLLKLIVSENYTMIKIYLPSGCLRALAVNGGGPGGRLGPTGAGLIHAAATVLPRVSFPTFLNLKKHILNLKISFRSYALPWCAVHSDGAARTHAAKDEHAPDRFRVILKHLNEVK